MPGFFSTHSGRSMVGAGPEIAVAIGSGPIGLHQWGGASRGRHRTVVTGIGGGGRLRTTVPDGFAMSPGSEPATIEALLCDYPRDAGDDPWSGRGREDRRPPHVRRVRLYSAVMVVARGGELVHLFHASVAPTAGVVRERIRSRFGSAAAEQAEIHVGVDLDCPVTTGMLPPAFRAVIERGRRVRWSAMASLDVTVEHRIPS